MKNSLVRDSNYEGDAGFTLVEMLAALALFSIVVTAIIGSVRFSFVAWQHSTRQTTRVEQVAVAHNLIRQLVIDAYPLFLGGDAGSARIDFAGGGDRINFLGNAPAVIGRGGRFRFDLHIERNKERNDLVLTSIPELSSPSNQAMFGKTSLLNDVDGMSISYFGSENTARNARWHEHWMQRNEFPKLIRVRVRFPRGDERAWPDLLIAPRISADVACQYDPITTRCKGR